MRPEWLPALHAVETIRDYSDPRTNVPDIRMELRMARNLDGRYRRVRENVLEMQMTITDPVTYTKPWVGEKKGLQLLPPGPNSEIRQELCVPSEEAMFNKGVRDPAGGRGAVQVPPTTVK